MTTVVILITSGTNWVTPSDCTSAQIDCIGAGSNGLGTGATNAAGGAGGSFARKNTLSLTPGANNAIQIGSGNSATATWFGSTTTVFAAAAGANSSVATSSASNFGDLVADGGGAGALSGTKGGGGGGAGGPNGAGGTGAGGTTGTGGAGDNGSGGAGGTTGAGSPGAEYTITAGGTAGSGGGGCGGTASITGGAAGNYGAGGGGNGKSSPAPGAGAGAGGAIIITYTSTPPGSAVARSTGIGATASVGNSMANSPGAISGVGAVLATARAFDNSVGTISGTGATSGVGLLFANSVGNISGLGRISGTGTVAAVPGRQNISYGFPFSSFVLQNKVKQAIFPGVYYDLKLPSSGASFANGVGTASGIGVVSGIGISFGNTVGNISGVSTSSSTGISFDNSVGSISGVSSTSSTGKSFGNGIGNISGISTSSSTGNSFGNSIGSISGISTSSSTGKSFGNTVGNISGISTSSSTGKSLSNTTGNISGISTISGVSLPQGTFGTASGISNVLASGISFANSVGNISGISSTSGTSKSFGNSVASSSGLSAANIISMSLSRSLGISSGFSVAQAIAFLNSIGTALGTSTVSAISLAGKLSNGTALGTANENGIGRALHIGVGQSSSLALVQGKGATTGVTHTIGSSINTSPVLAIGNMTSNINNNTNGINNSMSLLPTDLTAVNQLPTIVPTASDLVPIFHTNSQGVVLYSAKVGTVGGYLPSISNFGTVDPTGATDSSATFQTAINSGQSFYIPPGSYLIATTLIIDNVVNNSGQIIVGSGSGYGGGNFAGTTLIMGAGVTKLFSINGTVTGFMQGNAFRDFAIDMGNVSDVVSNYAFYITYAFDLSFDHMRIYNAGSAKRSFGIHAGVFTTQISNTSFSAAEIIGDGVVNPTTISFNNCDGQLINLYDCANITFNGGAIQPNYDQAIATFGNPVYFPAGGAVAPVNYVNAAGAYYVIAGMLDSMQEFSNLGCDWEIGGGYPSTYNDGTHGVKPLIAVIKISASVTNHFWLNTTFGNMYPLDTGNNFGTYIGIGSAGTVHNDVQSFNRTMFLNGGNAFYGFDASGNNTFLLDTSSGGLNLKYINVNSPSNGTIFNVSDSTGNTPVFAFTSPTPGLNTLNLGNGAKFNMYSDAGAVTNTFSIDSATGNVKGFNGGVTTTQMTASNGTFVANSGYWYGNSVTSYQVVGSRKTGWGAPTGATSTRTTFNTATVTLQQLANAVATLITDLTSHGLIGP